jgi:hypothetical protein
MAATLAASPTIGYTSMALGARAFAVVGHDPWTGARIDNMKDLLYFPIWLINHIVKY